MPFNVNNFMENVETRITGATIEELEQACANYGTATTPPQKARCVKSIIDILDQELDEATRYAIMQACGRRCIGASTVKSAQKLHQQASSLDDFLNLLNEHHIGGGHLERKGDTIHAAYDRCYCGSVNKTKVPFSETYCQCSCGWYQQLFEILLEKPVAVELLGSIIQGDARCEFLIHVGSVD
jgi:hypothetical protein